MTFASKLLKQYTVGLLRSHLYKAHSIPGPARFIQASQCVEEERAPNYNPRHFCPIQLHSVIANRYQVASKLGWGTSSTVWLARDLYQWRWLPPRYVAIKVNANNYKSKEYTEMELRITQRITQTNAADDGRYFVRTLLDSFDLQGPYGDYICMVFNPLYEPLWTLKRRFQGSVLPKDVLRTVIQMVVIGLHYLHTHCHVIHTDNVGVPVITDFGLSICGDKGPHKHSIRPNGSEAPEVIIGASWDYSVDIWNLGVLIWELLCGTGPFDCSTSSSDSTYSEEKHLASIISLIGPPPEDMLRRGSRSSRYFNDDGQFKFPGLISKERGLETKLTVIEGDEKQMFLNFVSRLLQWRPEDRATAEELLSDLWLNE
ncbi:unnamed protein product [Penicillium olsonii]|uniref:non-specific serine/threonine protein kinase n=1 Tax=Penicillium olsonii TaxID=99116 RepID=A0A9W4HC84_PENOL|nr:unnamed protein product [Penicillium olsonii]CAG8002824.1 unnamed protein product [Penicillium olsonii]